VVRPDGVAPLAMSSYCSVWYRLLKSRECRTVLLHIIANTNTNTNTNTN
jgi:hypothetical protein